MKKGVKGAAGVGTEAAGARRQSDRGKEGEKERERGSCFFSSFRL